MRHEAMAVFTHLQLVFVAVLMLSSQLDFAKAAVVLSGLKGSNLPGDALGNKPDPYVKIWCGSSSVVTGYFKNNANPSWDAEYYLSGCVSRNTIRLEVWDKDAKYDDRIGSYSGTVASGTNNKVSFSVGKGTMSFKYDVK
ncbi:uncharacterized protein isoform X2 [Danio rerio]